MSEGDSPFSRTRPYMPPVGEELPPGDRPPPPNGEGDYSGLDPPDQGQPPIGSPIEAKFFPIERWEEISVNLDEQSLIDGVLPKQGVGLIFGAYSTFKSFIALHMALCIAQGLLWADRQTEKRPVVYVAAEAAHGRGKRKAGYVKSKRVPDTGVDLFVISAAPNLGTSPGDRERLIATIESVKTAPGLIMLDTAAKTLGGADENGQGMAALLINAEALALRFGCLVLLVHHIGWDETAKTRPRGWSGLPGGLDVVILCECKKPDMFATLTIQKLRDEEAGIQFVAQLERVVLGVSKTGREISTLVVDRVEAGAPEHAAKGKTPRAIPRSRRLLMEMVELAIDEAGQDFRSFGDGPTVRAAPEEAVRLRYYIRIAEQAAPDESPVKLAARQRQAFSRAIKAALDAKDIIARKEDDRRFLWLPS
jgi:hypothetical protein